MMDITEAYSLIDKYNLREDAKAECRRRKIDEVPYDMLGHNQVYSDLLDKVWCALRDKRDAKLKKMKLTILDKTDDDEILNWNEEMKNISDAQKILLEVARKDFYLK